MGRPRSKIGVARVVSANMERVIITKINLVLLGILVMTIMIYIFISNLLAFQKYSISTSKAELHQLSAELAARSQQRDSGQDLPKLLLFARQAGFVEIKDADYVLQGEDFAVR